VYTHYIGPRIIVLGCGNIPHSKLLDLSEKLFGKVRKETEIEVINEDTPVFTGS
jgi:predicted Zn-dependent peptidase